MDISTKAVSLIAVGVFSAALILGIVLLCDLCKYLHQITSNNIKNTAIICIVSFIVVSSFFVIWNSVNYLSLTVDANQNVLATFGKIILQFRISSGVTNFIAVAYFITIKLEDVYKDTFLAIDKHRIFIGYIIYVITIVFWWLMLTFVHVLSHWFPVFATNKTFQLFLAISTVTYSVASEIYFVLILGLFNMKLFKFMSLTKTNNEILSLEINNRFKNFIIKQTNLISIITIAFIIFQVFAYWRWVHSVQNNMLNLAYQIVFILQQSIYAICIYLTFKFNNKHYKTCCKYSHFCCVYSCTKLTKQESQRSQYLNLKNSVSTLNLQMSQVDIHYICIIDKCSQFKKLFHILNNYHHVDDNKYELYDAADILNSFQHLLEYHDSDQDFDAIYEKLTYRSSGAVGCNYESCEIYSRHYSRRRRFVNKINKSVHVLSIDDDAKESSELNEDVDNGYYSIPDILDKLHSFYYHSYDSFARIRVSQQFGDSDERISEIHRMLKHRKHACNYNVLSNKFNSDLKQLEDGNNNNLNKNKDVYSFGERFEYEQKSSEWFVETKYQTLKSEFIYNEICNIDIDEYNKEYNKCVQYMKTEQVKKMQSDHINEGIDKDLSINHILSLLIYCNCDEYQAKWSETFRRIPYNESIESLKNRHCFFYFCSRYLRDLIEYFGFSLIANGNQTFYHGVNQLLYFTRTITKFNAPLSTSTEPTVAFNFSGDIGLVLELKYSSSTYLLHAKYFACAFFSDFSNEKECLFVGGVPMMIITNIINISNGVMYRKYINALNIITCVLNGAMETDNRCNYKFTADSIGLCCSLLSYQLMKNNDFNSDAFPEYIVNLLSRYCINLTHIMLFWHHMGVVEELKKLLCINESDMFFDLNFVLKLFPNLEQIEYFNNYASKNKLKLTIEEIIDNLAVAETNIYKLKYIIIHHKRLLSDNYKSKNGESEWDICQYDSKIIIHKKEDETKYLHLLTYKFNQITQANASKSMIQNVL